MFVRHTSLLAHVVTPFKDGMKRDDDREITDQGKALCEKMGSAFRKLMGDDCAAIHCMASTAKRSQQCVNAFKEGFGQEKESIKTKSSDFLYSRSLVKVNGVQRMAVQTGYHSLHEYCNLLSAEDLVRMTVCVALYVLFFEEEASFEALLEDCVKGRGNAIAFWAPRKYFSVSLAIVLAFTFDVPHEEIFDVFARNKLEAGDCYKIDFRGGRSISFTKCSDFCQE